MAADIIRESPSDREIPRSEGFREVERYNVSPSQVISPDLVRWGPVLAGVFSALSTTALLSVLGLAIGFSSVDSSDTLRSFGIGAGIWGAATALISFFVGGWVSGRTTTISDNFTRVFQGAMVWVVTVPLLLYVVGGGIGTLFKAVGGVVKTGVEAAAPIAGQQQAQPGQPQPGQENKGAPLDQQAQDTARRAVENLKQQATPERVQQTAEVASKAAWGALFSMIFGLIAAGFGGYVASRRRVLREMPVSTSTSSASQPSYH